MPFRDYVAWLAAQTEDEAKRYWTEELADLGEPLRLLDARSDGAGDDAAGRDEIVVALTSDETASLRRVARAAGLAPNILVEGAWAMALGHLGARDDVTFGLAVDGRGADVAGADEIVGVLVNNVPVRVRLDDEIPVADWLSGLQRRQAALRGAEHAPLEAIQPLRHTHGHAPASTSVVFPAGARTRPSDPTLLLNRGPRRTAAACAAAVLLAGYGPVSRWAG